MTLDEDGIIDALWDMVNEARLADALQVHSRFDAARDHLRAAIQAHVRAAVEEKTEGLRDLVRRLLDRRVPQPFFGGWKCWSCGNRGVSETTIPHLDGCEYVVARALGVDL